jgi:hypothetical protein
MGSGAVICIRTVFMGEAKTHREHGDPISLLLSQNNRIRVKLWLEGKLFGVEGFLQ